MISARRIFSDKLFPCAFATAFLWWLSLQQSGLFAFGWIALTPVLWACGDLVSPRARFFYGWRAGFLCFAWHNWWLLPTITKCSVVIGVPPVGGAFLGVFAIAAIAAGHGLGVAIVASVWNPRTRMVQCFPLLLPILVALLWLAFEWTRCQGELAHSWGALAYSQWRDLPLLQSAALIGQHGLSALCLWSAASAALWLQREYSARAPGLWRAPIAVFALLHLWGAWRIWEYDQTPKSAMKVLLVQTNVSSLAKNAGEGESQFDQAERLTREYFAREGKIDLALWPETSASVAGIRRGETETLGGFSDLNQTRHVSRAQKLASDIGAGILLGAQTYEFSQNQSAPRLLNRALLFSPQNAQQSSGKMHVVPFGERAPFGAVSALHWLRRFAPSPSVMPAQSVRTLQTKIGNREVSIGTLICFESCFRFPSRELKKHGAQILFVLTNDEWFGGTNAPWEHASMSAVRAAENGIALAQSANGGHSFVIDGRGRFLYRSDFGTMQAVAWDVPF